MVTYTFLSRLSAITIALILFVIILLLFYVGVRIRKYLLSKKTDHDERSFGATQGSLLGLLALLLSFTFSMSSSRHDLRLQVIVEEANDIGTAILRADLYPDTIRAAFRKDFKAYVESRIEFFDAGADTARIYRSLATGDSILKSLWNRAAVLGLDKENFHRTSQMVPALNAIIDIVTTRNAATLNKVPELILYMLFLICFFSAIMLGYSSGRDPDWIVIIAFSVMISTTIYLIIDLDRPRRGLITMQGVNKNMVNLRSMFSEGK